MDTVGIVVRGFGTITVRSSASTIRVYGNPTPQKQSIK